jgi:hypothetical protein
MHNVTLANRFGLVASFFLVSLFPLLLRGHRKRPGPLQHRAPSRLW